MKKLLIVILLALFLIPTSSLVVAKNNSPVVKPSATIQKEQTLLVAANLLKQKSLVKIEFSRLKDVVKAEYTLTYNFNNVQQGVIGNITPNGEKQIKAEIFLGTCSQNSCIKHSPKRADLTVKTTYKSGKVITNYAVK